jgi:hypothetical protein
VAEFEANFRLVRRHPQRAAHSSEVATRAWRLRLRQAATLRNSVRIGAAALALIGVVVLIVRPSTRTRAEAHFVVPSPLVVNDAIGAILNQAGGVSARADGRRIIVASSAADRVVARAHVVALARAGMDGARAHFSAVETQRADAAKVDRAQAASQLATLASRTGITDPEAAYRERVAVVQNLEEQRAVAVSTGQPLAAIDAQLAEDQQAAFELQLQVTRYNELIQTETTAGQRELEATRAINAMTPAAGSESIEVSDHSTGIGLGVATGVVALVVAGIAWFFSSRRRRGAPARDDAPDARRDPAASGESEEIALAEPEAAALDSFAGQGSRYLEFYRALAPSSPAELDASASQVDLVHEESLEGSADTERRAAHERDRFRP